MESLNYTILDYSYSKLTYNMIILRHMAIQDGNEKNKYL